MLRHLVLRLPSTPIDENNEFFIRMLIEMDGLQALYLSGVSFAKNFIRELVHQCLHVQYVQVVELPAAGLLPANADGAKMAENGKNAENAANMKSDDATADIEKVPQSEQTSAELRYLLLNRKQANGKLAIGHSDWFDVGVPIGIEIAEYRSISDKFVGPANGWYKRRVGQVVLAVPDEVELGEETFNNLSTFMPLLSAGHYFQQFSLKGDGFVAELVLPNKIQITFTHRRYMKLFTRRLENYVYGIVIASNFETVYEWELFDTFRKVQHLTTIEINSSNIMQTFLERLKAAESRNDFRDLQILSGTADGLVLAFTKFALDMYVGRAKVLRSLRFLHFRNQTIQIQSPKGYAVKENERECYQALDRKQPPIETGVCVKIEKLEATAAESEEEAKDSVPPLGKIGSATDNEGPVTPKNVHEWKNRTPKSDKYTSVNITHMSLSSPATQSPGK